MYEFGIPPKLRRLPLESVSRISKASSAGRLAIGPPSSSSLELRPHDRVIRRAGRFARLEIDVCALAAFGQRRSGQYMVDPPTPVILKRVPKIIPIGVLDPV